MSDLSSRVGVVSLFAQAPSMFIPFAMYHGYCAYYNGWGESIYIENKQISLNKLSFPITRALILMLVHSSCYTTYYFASLSNLNGGIITALFSTACIHTCLIFYFKYGQKITIRDYIGTTILLVSVTLIALGNPNE